MILGEPDIQRQVKTALEEAQAARTVGTRLNRLFQDALVTGKRARTETGIARGTFSVGAAAVKLASQIFGETLAGHTVLVLGAGKMSEVTARHLQAAGAPAVLVANRTYEKAVALAGQFGGSARRFDDLPQLLTVADIVVCSTAAPHPIVTRALMQDVMRARRGRPLYLVDIAVPRDVEAGVGKIDNAYLYNIDDLQELVVGARHTRAGEVARARVIVEASVAEYLRWERSLDVAPLVIAVRQKLDSVRLAELARLRTRLPDLSEKDWRTVEAALSSLTNKIAHPATVAIKTAPETEDGAATLDAIRRAFGLEEKGPPAPNNGGARQETGEDCPSSPTPPLLGAGGTHD
jgi:glutamyl-tRNA reductase